MNIKEKKKEKKKKSKIITPLDIFMQNNNIDEEKQKKEKKNKNIEIDDIYSGFLHVNNLIIKFNKNNK